MIATFALMIAAIGCWAMTEDEQNRMVWNHLDDILVEDVGHTAYMYFAKTAVDGDGIDEFVEFSRYEKDGHSHAAVQLFIRSGSSWTASERKSMAMLPCAFFRAHTKYTIDAIHCTISRKMPDRKNEEMS